MIPYGRQSIDEDDIRYVEQILRSEFLTQGPTTASFEQKVAYYVGAKHAVAVNSATSALHIACLALGLGNGDMLWTSAISFVASANCARYCSATVDFVEIDPDTFNICTIALEDKLRIAAQSGKLPKIIVAVHMCGQSPNMARISELAKIYGFSIIEDASHAIGAHYGGYPVGSCQFSDITVFSFHPVKIITTAEGGMALTNNFAHYKRMTALRSHGITRELELMHHRDVGPWHYEQLELGWNYRMNDIQAALGISQLKKIETFLNRRKKIADNYNVAFKNLPLKLPQREPLAISSWHLYVIQINDKMQRKDIFQHLRNNGIGVNVHYMPIYLHPYYKTLGYKPGYLPISEDYYSKAISIPIHAGLSETEQEVVVTEIKNKLNALLG